MSDTPRKRSRFDSPEPPAPRKSKFDRSRSRSPVRETKAEARRSRSPIAKADAVTDTAAAAPVRISTAEAVARAEATRAKINAAIAARGGIQHAPPVRKLPVEKAPVEPKDDVYQQGGDFIKDIEINGLRTRYTLTAAKFQHEIKEATGADVTTRGAYYPDKSMATAAAPPLFLHITSTSRDGLDKALVMIDQASNEPLPDLVDGRRFNRRPREADGDRDEHGRRKFPEDQVPIDLEPIPGFNLRATIVGAGGANVKHIQSTTMTRVQIKGRGSGFLEQGSNEESDQAMYLHITGQQPGQVDAAKQLCIELLESIKTRYTEFKEGRLSREALHGGDQESRHGGGQAPRGRGGFRGGYRQGAEDQQRGRYYDNDQRGYGGNGVGYPEGVLNYDNNVIAGVGAPNFDSIAGSAGGNDGGKGGHQASSDKGTFNPGYGEYGSVAPAADMQYGYGATTAPVQPQQAGYDMSQLTAMAAAAAGMDVLTYQAWIGYYAANPQADQYASQGGFAAYMQNLALYNQQQSNVNYAYPVVSADGVTQTFATSPPGHPAATTQAYAQGYGSYPQGYPAPYEQSQGYSAPTHEHAQGHPAPTHEHAQGAPLGAQYYTAVTPQQTYGYTAPVTAGDMAPPPRPTGGRTAYSGASLTPGT